MADRHSGHLNTDWHDCSNSARFLFIDVKKTPHSFVIPMK
ncbi:hypothetical protein BACIH_3751 [Bacillus amyloliquefaciens]|nr:hypothetical protein U471_37690 [Bacillus amyloliquefaciens CC178]KYC88787.1 hypothetical protein B4140_3629 [Bacillus amyloliquefaciens]RAP18260.1 hypothetical protein C2W63_02435 [Bacillus velezensis]QEY89841.1 hypothetical protein BACIT_1942 [Bacillus amyloliquefaciens]QEY95428.1 hypothetical protein BACIH_3751 [Bacillus amyloliquefaciens]